MQFASVFVEERVDRLFKGVFGCGGIAGIVSLTDSFEELERTCMCNQADSDSAYERCAYSPS